MRLFNGWNTIQGECHHAPLLKKLPETPTKIENTPQNDPLILYG